MKTLAARVLVILAGGLILLSALGIARAQLATPQAPTTTTAIFLPAVIDRSAPAATPTPSPTATTTGSVNLLAGNMPLPTGWHTNGPDTYWEGYLRVQGEPVVEMTLIDCGDNSGNNRLDIVRVYDPGNNLIVNQTNCTGNTIFTIPTAGRPGLYRVLLQDNDTQNGNGGNIWLNKLRDQRIYTNPANPALAATNLLTQIEPLPGGWVTGGHLTYWEGYIHVQNESSITVTATDCADDEGDGALDAIQITDSSGLIVGSVSGCSSSSRSFPINTQDKPGWYRLYFYDKDAGSDPGRSPAQNGGNLWVANLTDQHVYPTPGGEPPPPTTPTPTATATRPATATRTATATRAATATPTPSATPPTGFGWQPVGSGSASGGGISNNSGASQTVALAVGPDNTLYAAWSDTSSGNNEIYLRHWDGAAWRELGGSASGGGISDNSGSSFSPSIAVAPDGRPWVAWHDRTPGAPEIYVRRWSGTTWETVGANSASGGGISNNSGGSAFVDLQIDANGQAFATWTDDSSGNNEVYLRQWNGSAWVALGGSASGGGVSNTATRSGRPALALSDGLPIVAWAETGIVGEIYLRRFNGSAWIPLGNHSASDGGVSNTPGQSQYATIAYTVAGQPYVAWYDDTPGQLEIYAATLDGNQWVAAGNGAASGGGVSNTAGESTEPKLAAASDNPFLVWQETTAADNEVYIRRLVGANWVEVGSGSASGGGLSNNDGDSNYPVAAVTAGGRLYVAWEDKSGGDYEIYILTNATP